MFKHFNPLGSGKVKSSVPLAFCKSRLNLGGLSAETAITEALCHNSCGTIKSPPCPKVIGAYILLPYSVSIWAKYSRVDRVTNRPWKLVFLIKAAVVLLTSYVLVYTRTIYIWKTILRRYELIYLNILKLTLKWADCWMIITIRWISLDNVWKP